MKKISILFISLTIISPALFGNGLKQGSNNRPGPEDSFQSDSLASKQTPYAFPGAEGFGRNATGGRGGKVIYVTKLTDDGTKGTLRYAIDQPGKRYILFKVSGTIALNSRLNIENGDVTIAGQSAPGDGICIKDYPVYVSADNVIIRFIRFRMGDERKQEGDALGARFHKDIIIDHCSVSWSTDECLSFYQNTRTTVQWCIISESLSNSVHHKGAHGYGDIFGGKYASFHHNLLADHDSRNPRFGEARHSTFALSDLTDYRNNVVYNWGGNSAYGGEAMNVNIVNNYYKPGPATSNSVKHRIVSIDKRVRTSAKLYGIWGKFYISGNYMAGYPKTTKNNWKYGVFNQFSSKYGGIPQAAKDTIRVPDPHPVNGNVTTQTAQEAYKSVLKYAGASLIRDAVDKRIIKEVRTGRYTNEGSNGSTGGLIDSQSDVGGWPELKSLPAAKDTDNDGMPDDWETAHKLDPESPDANGRDLSTVYDNVEVYLNGLVKRITENQLK